MSQITEWEAVTRAGVLGEFPRSSSSSSRGEWEPIKYDDAIFDTALGDVFSPTCYVEC